MRHLIAVAVTVLLGITACSSEPVTQPAGTTTTPAVAATTTAPTSSTTTSSTPPPVSPPLAAAGDPFDEYAKLVGPLEPTLSKAQLREKYDTAVKMFCPGGRTQMDHLKTLASNPPGATSAKTSTANKNAATSIGALWQYGCDKGRDEALYTPLKSTAQGKGAWPCEPGYPNCSKADSDRYLHHKAFADCQANPATRWDIDTQTCKNK